MSGNDGSAGEYETSLLIDFLNVNYKIFAVLSVFGALSIYQLQLMDREQQTLFLEVGFACSLTLVVISSYAVWKNTSEKLDTMNSVPTSIDDFSNAVTLPKIFMLTFCGLVLSLLGAGGSRIQALGLIIVVAAFLIGVYVPKIAYDYEKKLLDLDDVAPLVPDEDSVRSAVLNLVYVFGPGLVVYITAGRAFLFLMRDLDFSPLIILYFETPTEFLIAVILSSLFSIILTSLLFLIMAVVAVIQRAVIGLVESPE